MKPIIVNLPPFTIGLLNDNADYCINVGDRRYVLGSLWKNLFRLQRNFIIIINFENHLIYVKSKAIEDLIF